MAMNDRMETGSMSGTYSDRPAERAGDQIAEVAGQAGVKAQEQLDRLADAIRRRPVQAAGIAAGIGFVLALLARR